MARLIVLSIAKSLVGCWVGWVMCLVGPALFAAPISSHLRWSNPLPHGNNVYGMAYSSELQRAVQVTERGLIYYSDDLLDWTPRETGSDQVLRAVTFLPKGRMVAVGENGTIVYSDDLGKLQFLSSALLLSGPTTDWLEGVAASPNGLVAVGDQGAIYASTDGSAWSRIASPITAYLSGVAYGSNGYVAVGEAGVIAQSGNGTNWTQRVVGTEDWLGISAGPAGYLAVGRSGRYGTSLDGLSWVLGSTGRTNDLWTSAQNATSRLMAGSQELLISEGGGLWIDQLTLTNSPPPPATLYSSFGLSNYFLVSGRAGITVEGYQATNSTAYLWLENSPSLRSWMWDVNLLNGLWVTVGQQGTLLTSEDGVSWELEPVPASAASATLLGVGGNTNVLIAVGSRGTILRSPNTVTNIQVTVVINGQTVVTNIESSTYGLIWYESINHPTTNLLQSVTAGPDRFVAVGDGGDILESADGGLWTRRSAPSTNLLSSVVSTSEGFFACGQNGSMTASVNGILWRKINSPVSQWLFRAREHDGLVVVVGENGTVLTSRNLASWTVRSPGTTEFLTDAAWVGERCYISGQAGTLLSTTNFVDWETLNPFSYRDFYGLKGDDRQLVMVGTDGLVMRGTMIPETSPVDFLSFSHTEESDAITVENLFLFGGRVDQRFVLESAEDAAHPIWTEMVYLELSQTGGTLGYLQPVRKSSAPTRQHFRTRLVTP